MDLGKNQVVLVVEDSVVQRESVAAQFQEIGFETVLQAENGAVALEMLKARGEHIVDLVITDLDMPVMDGIELIRHLAERRLARSVIVVSARDPRMLEVVEVIGQQDDSLNLLGTVSKPIHREDLVALLGKICRCGDKPVSVAPAVRLELANELKHAVEAGQFVPHYQPIVSIETGAVCDIEVLARWMHPVHGVLLPVHFIPRIEGSPLMIPFTLGIVTKAFMQMAQWNASGQSFCSVSINLSADNLADASFCEQLFQLASEYNIAPESVVWEVTETMVMSNLAQCLANLVRLRLKGFGLAMDDYGVGYSSAQQLSSCPFTRLKIDRVFVDGASHRANRRAVLESSIQMGHRLNAETIGEGVETEEDLALLRELGCDYAQGFLIARPMPGAELESWMQQRENMARDRQAS